MVSYSYFAILIIITVVMVIVMMIVMIIIVIIVIVIVIVIVITILLSVHRGGVDAVHLLRVSPLRVLESNFPRDSL